MSKVTVFTDGASRGNPGDAGIGIVVASEDGTVLKEISHYIGTATNNVAEYTALITGLREAAELGATEVEVCTDSELMAHQINGLYRVKSPALQPLFAEATRLLRSFRRASVSHVYREHNRRADQLAGKAARKAAKSRSAPMPESQGKLGL